MMTNPTSSQVLAALAANRNAVSHIDYALFPLGFLADLGIKFSQSCGATKDAEVNDNWHIDLVCLSASQLGDLARKIGLARCLGRLLEKNVPKILAEAVVSARINLADMQGNVRGKVEMAIRQLS